MGLVLVSVWHMLRQLHQINLATAACLIVGAVFAWWFSGISPLNMAEPDLLTFFICGSIAICAMILPGISGSFLLLLLGVYQPVLTAVSTMNIPVLAVLALGCVTGLLLFSRLLSWLLSHKRQVTFGFLTGMMLGSINRLWPWKNLFEGELRNVLPHTYEQLTGDSALLIPAALAATVAIIIVLAIEQLAERSG